MSNSKPVKLPRRMSLREEIVEAQRERSERTRKIVQEWFDRTRMPEHLRQRLRRNVSTFD